LAVFLKLSLSGVLNETKELFDDDAINLQMEAIKEHINFFVHAMQLAPETLVILRAVMVADFIAS